MALFWFCASVAWAAGLTSLKNGTDVDDYIKYANQCKAPVNCAVLKKAGYATLTISVVSTRCSKEYATCFSCTVHI